MATGSNSGGQMQLRRHKTKKAINGTVYCEADGFKPGVLPILIRNFAFPKKLYLSLLSIDT